MTTVANQLFTDFAIGDVITAAHLNTIKNSLATIDSLAVLPATSFQVTVNTAADQSIAAGANATLAVMPVTVPAGSSLVLTRVRYNARETGSQLRAKISQASIWTAASAASEETPGTTLYTNSSGSPATVTVTFVVNNPTAGALTMLTGTVIWAHLSIQ